MMDELGGPLWNKDRTAVAMNGQAGYDAMEYLLTLIQKDRSVIPAPPESGLPSAWPAGRNTGKVGMRETTDPLWKIAMPGFTSPDGRTRPLAVRYTELAEAMVPALIDGFKGKIPPRQAVDDSVWAGTAFWKSIGGNADTAASD
jgi:hypothetical protein